MKLLPRLPFSLFGLLLVLWSVLLATGAYAIWRYSATPGTMGDTPASWPATVQFKQKPSTPTLVMLIHPQCPCSRASLVELDRLMNQIQADAWVLFLKPAEAGEDWEKTQLWKMAENIPGAKLMADTDGQIASAFGAETSGHVLFYDAVGALRYSGGLTESRGHEGPNAGSEVIKAAFSVNGSGGVLGKIFGCPLTNQQKTP